MIANRIFQIIDTTRQIEIQNTPYNLEESGLIYEIATAGDELNIAKISFIASGEADSKSWILLNRLVEDTLLQIDGITEVKISHRPHSNLQHCPKEIQEKF